MIKTEPYTLLYDTMIHGPILALYSDSTVWPMTPNPCHLRPEPEPKIATSPGLMLPQSSMSE